jgi:two-component system OmpR family response regulator
VDRNKLIYIVDDDPVINMLVTRQLASEGYMVKSFRYGEECLKQLDTNPDLIVLDYYFSGGNNEVMNGMEVYTRITELMPRNHVVVLSGQEKGEIVLELARKGIDDYVIKDHNLIDSLIVSVRESLKR